MLTRETSFTPGGLSSAELELEFNNIVNYINNRLLSSPLSANLDFADLFTVTNLRTFWNVLNVAEYASLAAAEAALPSTGGILYIPPQTTIDIASTVTLTKDNTWIVGGGPSSVLRRAAGTFNATQNTMLLYNNRLNCGIKDLQLDGQGLSNAATTGLGAVLVYGTSTNFTFTGNYVRRWGASPEANTSPNDGIRIGIDEASVPQGLRIQGNTFEDIRRSAVRLTNCQIGNVIGNNILQLTVTSVGAGVHCETPASGNARMKHITIANNPITGSGAVLVDRGIAVIHGPATPSVDCSRIMIVGNEIDNTALSGIYVEKGFLVGVGNNVVVDTNLSGTAEIGGIYSLNTAYLTIGNNVLSSIGSAVAGSAANGIMALASSGATQGFYQINGNVVRDVANNGISVQLSGVVTVPSARIQGNTVSRFGRTNGGGGVAAGIDILVGNGTTLSEFGANDNVVTLDGTTPGTASTNGFRAEYTGTGTGARAQLVGNDFGGAASGAGLAYDFVGSATVPTTIDVGHNLT